ncbi:phosphatase PAP2 family protein [Blastococcus brunescens]|uniref:Phosphatase PAP2 family protein n=1 Tax=Blastococcus brunescens TaxID=1564165 RepID=A0ABZ1B7B6_9ACTN|nr:phosphatase PAP2 family protein [Blastococcus sp. BMG 8361]WRL66272.1 phosphatase PAP2 family protein [Blastococcus sp. BMG 8361]
MLVVLAVSFTRLALGVHFVSDVLAGWALGLGWLAVTAGTFRAWQHSRGRYADEPLDPLDLDPDEAPQLVVRAEPHRSLPATAGRLAGAAAVVVAALGVLGLLVTAVLTDTWLGRLDRDIVASLVEERTAFRSDLATAVSTLGGTRAVIAVGLSAAVLALAVTGRRRPALFVVVTLVGEVLLYFVVAQIVGRLRPDVADLVSELPSGASWPSGHSAAAAALYGAVAALVLVSSRSPWRWAVLALPVVLAPAIGLSRLYVAAHYPTDVVAGLVLGGAWVLVCARFVLVPAAADAARRADAGAAR